MTVAVKIIEDSLSSAGARLTTFQLRYPRLIHAEFMTHRAISRNASSSRAIPVEKMMQSVIDDPAEPGRWGLNGPGMQDRGEAPADVIEEARGLWLGACEQALRYARELTRLGVHKQVANRILEPFQHIDVVATATDWSNFFALRCHRDAEPTFQDLAWAMADEYHRHEPRRLWLGQWHLPYVRDDERDLDIGTQQRLSVARCARVSYRNHDGTQPLIEKDLELCRRLLGGLEDGEPGHMSPFEHQGTPMKEAGDRSGNFCGWHQFRKSVAGEIVANFDYDAARQSRPRDL